MTRTNMSKWGKNRRQRSVGERSSGTELREMWKGMPDCLVARLQPPRRVSEEDARINYNYRGLGMQDPVALVFRVCDGLKPMATILMRCPKRRHATDTAVAVATQRVGLGCQAYWTRTGRREAVIYQPQATLTDYYDPAAVIARYAEIGIALPQDLFETPLMRFARGLANEQFPEPVRMPLIGLCFGYPLSETIDLIRAMRLADGPLPQGGQNVLLGHAKQAVQGVGGHGVGV